MTQAGTPSGWQDYVELEKLTRALADKVRLNIVRILANSQEVNVTDLTQQLLISQPLVSWHLAILRRNGLVRTRRKGRLVYCSLDTARCQQALQWLGAVVSGDPELAGQANGIVGTAGSTLSSPAAPATPANTSGASGASSASSASSAPGAPSGKPSSKPADARPAQQF